MDVLDCAVEEDRWTSGYCGDVPFDVDDFVAWDDGSCSRGC
jgi:hypothetical protein